MKNNTFRIMVENESCKIFELKNWNCSNAWANNVIYLIFVRVLYSYYSVIVNAFHEKSGYMKYSLCTINCLRVESRCVSGFLRGEVSFTTPKMQWSSYVFRDTTFTFTGGLGKLGWSKNKLAMHSPAVQTPCIILISFRAWIISIHIRSWVTLLMGNVMLCGIIQG